MVKTNVYKTNSGFVFVDCNNFIDQLEIDLQDYNFETACSKKDKKKLIFHFFTTYLLSISKSKFNNFKPVFYLTAYKINKFDKIEYINKTVSLLKRFLPVPLILLDDDTIFIKNNGHLRELENKVKLFYIKRGSNTVKLRKYLQEEQFYELINVLQDIKNIKTLVN